MNSGYIIRPAKDEEIGQIAQLCIASWTRTYLGIVSDWNPNIDKHEVEKLFSLRLKDPEKTMLAAVLNNGEVAGVIMAQPEDELPQVPFVTSLHVKKIFQGKGIGKALLMKVARHFTERGLYKLALSVIKGNERARRIYLHLGAKEIKFKLHTQKPIAMEHLLLWEDSRILLKTDTDSANIPIP